MFVGTSLSTSLHLLYYRMIEMMFSKTLLYYTSLFDDVKVFNLRDLKIINI